MELGESPMVGGGFFRIIISYVFLPFVHPRPGRSWMWFRVAFFAIWSFFAIYFPEF